MKKNVFAFCLAFSTILGSATAHAGSSDGVVTSITAHEHDVVMFIAGTHSGKPACSTIGDQWALSLKTQTGRAMYALLLSAQAQGKAVSIYGSDACSAWGDREAPYALTIRP